MDESDPRQSLDTLLALQRVDREIGRLDAAEADIQGIIAGLGKDIASFEARQAECRTACNQAELHQRALDAKLKQLDETMRRIMTTRDAASSADAIGASERELATRHDERDALENEGLELLERIETLIRDARIAAETATSRARERDEQTQRLVALKEQHTGVRGGFAGQRAALLGQLPLRLTEEYESLRAEYAGAAVARADEGMCAACGGAISSQVLAHVGKTVVRCPSCRRFLASARG